MAPKRARWMVLMLTIVFGVLVVWWCVGVEMIILNC